MIIKITIFVAISGKEFKSFRPTIQIDNTHKNKNEKSNKETLDKENELLKKKLEELHRETEHLKKYIKSLKSRVIIIILITKLN